MTTYTFHKNNNAINFPIFNTKSTKPNYSEILDDLIATNMINNNKYLKKKFENIDKTTKTSCPFANLCGASLLKIDTLTAFDKAKNFLKNYKKDINNIKLAKGKEYELSDGTPIIFFDDEIQIGFNTYSLTDIEKYNFLDIIPAEAKNLIINITINL